MKVKSNELLIVIEALNALLRDLLDACDRCPTTIEYSETLAKLEQKHDKCQKMLLKAEKAFDESFGV
jgi:hypothetical protein